MPDARAILRYRGPGVSDEHKCAEMLNGRPLRDLIVAWDAYETRHAREQRADLRQHAVLGPPWIAIGHALLTLIHGPCEGLDQQSLRLNIADALEARYLSKKGRARCRK